LCRRLAGHSWQFGGLFGCRLYSRERRQRGPFGLLCQNVSSSLQCQLALHNFELSTGANAILSYSFFAPFLKAQVIGVLTLFRQGFILRFQTPNRFFQLSVALFQLGNAKLQVFNRHVRRLINLSSCLMNQIHQLRVAVQSRSWNASLISYRIRVDVETLCLQQLYCGSN
jgi:hypothetical protein